MYKIANFIMICGYVGVTQASCDEDVFRVSPVVSSQNRTLSMGQNDLKNNDQDINNRSQETYAGTQDVGPGSKIPARMSSSLLNARLGSSPPAWLRRESKPRSYSTPEMVVSLHGPTKGIKIGFEPNSNT